MMSKQNSTSPKRISVDVVLIGSGFASSILARMLLSKGLSVAIIERGRHPRFALGESTTPLANLALERIAQGYGLEDLSRLARYGRWKRSLPSLRCGLKRGFTFYSHRRGQEFDAESSRLLVAASLDTATADTHWFRQDVDAHLLAAARAAGAEYFDSTEIDTIEIDHQAGPGAVRVAAHRHETNLEIAAAQIVDGSGRGNCLADQIGIPFREPTICSSLIYAHIETPKPFARDFETGPYPDELSAVHHLLDDGWIYQLDFDHGQSSVGLILYGAPQISDPSQTWEATIAQYPTLAAHLGNPQPVMPMRSVARMQHRLAACAGPGWFLLPHTYAFFDPMFSTGIAWSLLAVERLADVLISGRRAEEYRHLLTIEADQIERLINVSYRAAESDFELFRAISFLYFATVSRAEISQRLGLGSTYWNAFLDADQSLVEPNLFARLEADMHSGTKSHDDIRRWLLQEIRAFDVIGLTDSRKRSLYPVDLDALLDHHHLLGMSRSDMLQSLPKLRG